MRSLLRFRVLFLACALCACGAEWRNFDSDEELPESNEPHSFGSVERPHAHRDFPQPFAVVWPATVEALHTRGIGVPRSARPEGQRAVIDLDGLLVLVEARNKGRVCVLLRFRALEQAEGVTAAKALLDEIQGRL